MTMSVVGGCIRRWGGGARRDLRERLTTKLTFPPINAHLDVSTTRRLAREKFRRPTRLFSSQRLSIPAEMPANIRDHRRSTVIAETCSRKRASGLLFSRGRTRARALISVAFTSASRNYGFSSGIQAFISRERTVVNTEHQ